jgi:ABC-type nitrate/sulfonate/bicarbonate transport system permease component
VTTGRPTARAWPMPRRRPLTPGGGGLARRLPLLALPLLGLALWQGAVWLFRPRPWLLPSPLDIAGTLADERSRLWFHAVATIQETLLGLGAALVAGVALAVLISASRAAERTIYPWVVASQTVPILAVAPLLGVWLDYGTAQVLVAALFSFFPVVVNGVHGLRAADPELGRALRTMGATRLEVWRRATFPAALPALFAGARMAAVFAVTGAVVGEYVGADRGLGYLSEISTAQFQTVLTFACVAWLAAIGVALFALIALAERLALPYRRHPVRPRRRVAP